MEFHYSLINICWLILIYGFLGWCTEVVYAALRHGKFVNRGFLSGPICPIYGFGFTGIVLLLNPVLDRPLFLFLGSVVLTSAIELLTGFLLEKFFHRKWWDYTDRPFNIGGYVCLEFSVIWGLGALLTIKLIHIPLETLITKIPETLGMVLLIAVGAIFVTDFVLTLIAVLKIPAHNKRMDEIEAQLTRISVTIGENLSDTALKAKEKGLSAKAGLTESKEKLVQNLAGKDIFLPDLSATKEDLLKKKKELEEKYRILLSHRSFTHRRIMKAFPALNKPKDKTKKK